MINSSLRCLAVWPGRPQVRHGKRVRMETAPEDLDTQQFLQAYIAEMDSGPKMLKKRKLAWFVGCFEHGDSEAKFLGESIDKVGIQLSFVVECTYPTCALTGLNNELHSPCFEPGMSACNGFVE